MYSKQKFALKVWLVGAVITVALTLTIGCNSEKHETKVEPKKATAEPPVGNAIWGADYCLQTFMKTAPAAPVHFAYKASNNDGESRSFEGDVAADTADVVLFNRQPATPDLAQNSAYKVHDGVADFTNNFHYTRAAEHEWAMAPTMPVQSTTPWSEFTNHPAVEKVGPENLNGFDTVKYTIDSSKQSQFERVGFTSAYGIKDFNVKGTVWVTKDTGCMLQWVIDATTEHKDGSVKKVHYEGTVTKK